MREGNVEYEGQNDMKDSTSALTGAGKDISLHSE